MESEKEKNEVKKDCFAYDKKKDNCKALKSLYCEFEKCNFYKTKKCAGYDFDYDFEW